MLPGQLPTAIIAWMPPWLTGMLGRAGCPPRCPHLTVRRRANPRSISPSQRSSPSIHPPFADSSKGTPAGPAARPCHPSRSGTQHHPPSPRMPRVSWRIGRNRQKLTDSHQSSIVAQDCCIDRRYRCRAVGGVRMLEGTTLERGGGLFGECANAPVGCLKCSTARG